MKRWMRTLACALLLAALPIVPAAGEEPDEQTMAREPVAVATLDPGATPEPPDLVYALSDDDGREEETVLEEPPRPSFVEKLLEVAVGELGYTEGANNETKYGAWAGDPNAAWCAEFVCWCVHQVDERYQTNLLDVVYPNYSGQNTGRDWLIDRGRFVYRKGNCPNWGYQWLKGAQGLMKKNDYVPRSGDLVFFSYNEAGDTEHVALVEYCAQNAAGEVIVHVIEGNNPSSVQRNSYRLDNSQILGFGACEDVVDTTMRSGNRGDKVLWLQEALHQLGLLDERHLTGAFGGNTKAAVMAFQSERMVNQNANGIADMATQRAIREEVERAALNDPESWLVTE